MAQALLYLAALLLQDRAVWLFYLDPRIGLFLLESAIRQREVFPGLLSWMSVILLGVVGGTLVRNPSRVRLYLTAEAILAFPTFIFIVAVVAANMGPAQGFSVGELLVPVPVFLVVSAFPFCIAYRSLKPLANPPLAADPTAKKSGGRLKRSR